ncbi:MAG: heavy-metal-associated domain-containing protein [Betaproteobacteria bacterium]|nr:heavy-metal-associated domain-containing protein [Betaproteobacteria bacterium]
MSEVTIKIEGMSCSGCASNVAKALKALPGVTGVEVSLEQACAVVQYDPAAVNEAVMRLTVEEAGFDAPHE